MPDTLAPNFASWLPTQPYSALVHIRPYDATTNPLPAAIRYLNAGSINYPFHPHGSDERVVNRDGRVLEGPNTEDLAYKKYLLDVGPGQTLDVLMDWRDVEEWDPATNPIPTQIPVITDQDLVGPDTWFSESGYLGVKNDAPDEHHVEQRVRRVLPHRSQPRAGAGNQLRRSLRRHDDGLPHRPAQRLPGEVRTGR